MSGGVDSSVAAALLRERASCVVGLHMILHREPAKGPLTAALERARQAARHLGIPLHEIDLRADFRRAVVEPFERSYREGRTPNPCLTCNPAIKFGALLERARELCGATCLATGHYARLGGANGDRALLRGADPAKDQSYFLALVPRERLSELRFPLGELTKAAVRQMAEGYRFWEELPEESQEVCFLAGEDYRRLLGGQERPGEIVDLAGHAVGEHRGVWNYTIGQRRGLGVCGPEPLYVRRLEPAANRVVVAPAGQAPFRSMSVGRLNWLCQPRERLRCTVRTRYRQADQSCEATLGQDGCLRVTFDEPQRAVSPGQGAVFYAGERVLLGGIIEQAD